MLDKKTGERDWFCHACGWELDHDDLPRGSKGSNELAKRAAVPLHICYIVVT